MTSPLKPIIRTAAGAILALPLAGCITVKAPEKPIEINLNVDIKQEVLVRLQQDVQKLIEQNPQAFPPAPGTKQ
jgi:YnbE-like lipoprotein